MHTRASSKISTIHICTMYLLLWFRCYLSCWKTRLEYRKFRQGNNEVFHHVQIYREHNKHFLPHFTKIKGIFSNKMIFRSQANKKDDTPSQNCMIWKYIGSKVYPWRIGYTLMFLLFAFCGFNFLLTMRRKFYGSYNSNGEFRLW